MMIPKIIINKITFNKIIKHLIQSFHKIYHLSHRMNMKHQIILNILAKDLKKEK